VPYAELTIAALLVLLLVAVIYAAYKLGGAKATAAKEQAEASLNRERKVEDAVDEARRHPITPDDLGLRDEGGGPPPG
jgi:hypothetical protein